MVRLSEDASRSMRESLSRRPLYAVLFATAEDIGLPYSPLVATEQGQGSQFTVPHGFDREVAATLPGLWYCLHLPNTLLELTDIPARAIKAYQDLHLSHRILLSPVGAFDRAYVGDWSPLTVPVVVVCPDDLIGEATRRSSALGFAFPPVSYSELSDDSLRAHWQAIYARFGSGIPYLGDEPRLASRLDIEPTDLPRRWLARQMGFKRRAQFVAQGDLRSLMDEALWQQVLLAATARLENEGATPRVAKRRMPQVVEEEHAKLRIPVALALPGVASSYSRRAYERSLRDRIQPLAAVDAADTWTIKILERPDSLIERSAIEFVTTHRALATYGVGLMIPSVPSRAFTVLAELERHYAAMPRGPKVWRLLDRLQSAAEAISSDALTAAISRASRLTVFSNFPLGLLRLSEDTDPLSCRVPIAYQPLLPLTRAVQFELLDVAAVDLTSGFRVLVAECIPAADPVGRASRSGWEFVDDMVRRSGQALTLEYVETLSLDALRQALAAKEPEILVISAHGALLGNAAGIVIGGKLWLGLGFEHLPPVVILSACHVAPRGMGAVSISDMLLREGVMAVLGTQVPINVFNNAVLMMRFFLYMTEVLAKREEYSSLLDAWHFVQTSNAINDILNGSRPLRAWGQAIMHTGRPLIEEFMNLRSKGRLRLSHIYKDTERVLETVADEEGIGDKVRSWLRSPGYVPESLFYTFAGRPERIFLRPPGSIPRQAWEARPPANQ